MFNNEAKIKLSHRIDGRPVDRLRSTLHLIGRREAGLSRQRRDLAVPSLAVSLYPVLPVTPPTAFKWLWRRSAINTTACSANTCRHSRPVHRRTDGPWMDRKTDRPTDQPTDWPTDRRTKNRRSDGPKDRWTKNRQTEEPKTDGPKDQQTDGPTHRQTKWPTDQQTDKPITENGPTTQQTNEPNVKISSHHVQLATRRMT